MTKRNLRYITYMAIVLIVLFGTDVSAQATLPENDSINFTFLFKFILAGLVGVLIWIARGSEERLTKAEKRLQEFNVISAERQNVIEHNIARIHAVEQEQKQLLTMISLQRETLLTKYLDKEETERHRFKVEDTLAKQADILNTISHRLDMMARPFHRAEDDERRGIG